MRVARDLHPVAWWIWAVGIAACASQTTNPLLLGLLLVAVCATVLVCRSDHPWSRSFRLYLWLGLFTVVFRVLLRVVLGGDAPGHVLLALPSLPLPQAAAGISLLGPLTREEVLAASYEGLRLAVVIIAVGAANALANPKRLMKSLPPALYEVGTAMTVAITVIPQLADSAARVRAAQQLRGAPAGRWARLRSVRRLLVPVLEDAFERSLALAAGMDARGYGRTGEVAPARRRLTGALMLVGLLGVAIGVYAVLDGTVPRPLGVPMLLLGLLLALVGLVSAGRGVQRTRYRPDRWRLPEVLVAFSGAAAAALMVVVGASTGRIAHPGVEAAPTVSLLALAAALVGVVALLVAPPPSTALRGTGTDEANGAEAADGATDPVVHPAHRGPRAGAAAPRGSADHEAVAS